MSEILAKTRKSLGKNGFRNIETNERSGALVLEGNVDSWDEKIRAGYLAAGRGYRGVVNRLNVRGIESEKMPKPEFSDDLHERRCFDVVVIGAGVVGCMIARELSRFNLSVAVMDKEEDVARHASGRNDGMIHPGFAPSPGSKKAHYNVRGNAMYPALCRELSVDYKIPGSLILFETRLMRFLVPFFKARAKRNGVPEYEYVSPSRVAQMEPNATLEQKGAFFLPTAGVLSPYALTIAVAENAFANGVEFLFETHVEGFVRNGGRIRGIRTNRGEIGAGVVVNAAGVWSDKVAEMADDSFFSIHPRKGTDAVLDVRTGGTQTRIMAMPSLMQLTSKTKGGGLIPTVEGNILVGPTAEETSVREDYSTDRENLEKLFSQFHINGKIRRSDVITYFSGTRACTYEEDFIVEVSENVENLVHAAGIQSPGLASAPAIAADISEMVVAVAGRKKKVVPNESFEPTRKEKLMPYQISSRKRNDLVTEDRLNGRIVCRCEAVSEADIRDAIRRNPSAFSLDSIKRRTRAGTGRCQGGFCTPRVMEIIRDETGMNPHAITKNGRGSNIIKGMTKEGISYPDAPNRKLVRVDE